MKALILKARILEKLKGMLERRFPERRMFLRSDTETRFIRLTSTTQLIAWVGGITIVAWSVIATAILLMDSIGSGNLRQQALREQIAYETRLNTLSSERDARAKEAQMAHERFNVALGQISKMQSQLLASEDRRSELEQGIEIIQTTLRGAMKERDEARREASRLAATLANTNATAVTDAGHVRDVEATVDFLTSALTSTASERDSLATTAEDEKKTVDDLVLEAKLVEQRNDHIFSQLEDAVTVSLTPLDKMFRAAGLPTDKIIEQVRRGYSGQGGPLTPLSFSTMGGQAPNPDSLRANSILSSLDRMNLYRIAAQKVPFVLPVKAAFRITSGFGYRHDPVTGGRRMHKGVDFAAGYGTPIYATADGVVIKAGWGTGYGRVIEIKHAFGLQTRYAHLSKIRVKVGDRVSRGQRIGDMGSSGHSTGTHLHYEIRVGGKAINPMIYIKAAKDVL